MIRRNGYKIANPKVGAGIRREELGSLAGGTQAQPVFRRRRRRVWDLLVCIGVQIVWNGLSKLLSSLPHLAAASDARANWNHRRPREA